jgi:hypothetical protein
MFPKSQSQASSLRKVQSCDTLRAGNNNGGRRDFTTARKSTATADSSRSQSSSPVVGREVFPVIEGNSSPNSRRADGEHCATRFLLIEGSGLNLRREEVYINTPRRHYDYATISTAVAITSA